MLALSAAAKKGLRPELVDLIDYRCRRSTAAPCLDMHSKDFRARGGTEQRLYMVSACERAALAWAEAVTRLTDNEVPDGARAIQRGRARAADARDRHHQRLEPAEHRVPHAGRRLPVPLQALGGIETVREGEA